MRLGSRVPAVGSRSSIDPTSRLSARSTTVMFGGGQPPRDDARASAPLSTWRLKVNLFIPMIQAASLIEISSKALPQARVASDLLPAASQKLGPNHLFCFPRREDPLRYPSRE